MVITDLLTVTATKERLKQSRSHISKFSFGSFTEIMCVNWDREVCRRRWPRFQEWVVSRNTKKRGPGDFSKKRITLLEISIHWGNGWDHEKRTLVLEHKNPKRFYHWWQKVQKMKKQSIDRCLTDCRCVTCNLGSVQRIENAVRYNFPRKEPG